MAVSWALIFFIPNKFTVYLRNLSKTSALAE